MAPLYEELCTELKWPVDKPLLAKMQANNEEKFKKLDETLKDAEENLGETEITDALYAKAEYLCQIGDKVCTDNSFDFVSVNRIKTPYDYYYCLVIIDEMSWCLEGFIALLWWLFLYILKMYFSFHFQEKALTVFLLAYEKAVALGYKLDILFYQIRIGLFYLDNDLITRNIDKAKT